MDDRFAASLGFVVAGLGLAAGALDWTPAAAALGLGSPVAVGLAALALVAFALRRYGVAGRGASLVALAALGLLAGYAVAALVGPVVLGGEPPAVGPGLWLGMAVGLAGVAVAYADRAGLDRRAVLGRTRAFAVGSFVGVAGLLVGNFVGFLPVAAYGGSLSPLVSLAVVTVLFGAGLGVVAVGFLVVTEYGLGYLDVAMPDRRDLLYTAGGVVGIFGLLVALGLLSQALGLGGAESSVVGEARENPEVLLALIPLSWLVIGTGEELLFRNVIQKYLSGVYSSTAAVLLGCVIFTLMHTVTYYTPDPVALFSTLVRLFVLSLVLGVAYERTRNVVVPVVIHGTFNAVQFAVLYVSLAGGV